MKVRRSFLYLGLMGLLLLTLDSLQRWIYVEYAPAQPAFRAGQGEGPITSVLMVAGQGLDEAESATSLRDLQNAYKALRSHTRGTLEVTSITPGASNYSNKGVVDVLCSTTCDRLVVYLTGHGGGKNFGAVGGLNLPRDLLAEALQQAQYKEAIVVVDCCWSGEFARSFESRDFPGRVTLITSTDAKHPSPFPVSFLSPRSFGNSLFSYWHLGPERALEETNRIRRNLRPLYDESFRLEGTILEIP